MSDVVDLRRVTREVLTVDLVKSYEALTNMAGMVLATASGARALLLAAGVTQRPEVAQLFETAMDNLDRAIGMFAEQSKATLSIQNRLQAGAHEITAKT